MTLLAVLGFPIAHSQSPPIHRAAFAALGLDWWYTRIRCGEAGLERFIRGRGPEWRGFSLTMPLKEEAFRLAVDVDPVARESGVANTLLRRADGGWDAFNTDVAGLAAAIRNAGHDASRTIIIGSGATAVSAILAARSLGARSIDLVARNADAVASLVERFGGSAGAGSDPAGAEPPILAGTPIGELDELLARGADGAPHTLIISTLPGPAAATTATPDAATRVPLFDAAYDPWPSPFAARWTAAGGIATPGIDMLVEQAIIQDRIFLTGDPAAPLPDEAAVRAAVARETARSA